MERGEFGGIFKELVKGDSIEPEEQVYYEMLNEIFEREFPEGVIDIGKLSESALDEITRIGTEAGLILTPEEQFRQELTNSEWDN